MKKILFIATTNLHERNGGALATLAYYNALRACYKDILDIALPSEYCYGDYASAIAIPSRNRFTTIFNIVRGQFHRYKEFFSAFLKKKSMLYKLVIINGGFYAGDMVRMFQVYGIKVIVIHHNYEPEYHMDNRTLPTLGGIIPYFVAFNERKAYRNADLNVFLTSSDISLHYSHYGSCKNKPFLLGVFEPFLEQTYPGENDKLTKRSVSNIVITGSMNSVQTIKGVMDFSNSYFPIVHKLLPEWNIVIAGRNPDKSIYRFAQANSDCVKIIANPLDINEVISDGKIFLCPTQVGGGLKLRLMDGLRNGLPILVHQVSSRGYEAFHGYPFFRIYHDKNSFTDGLKKLVDFIQDNSDYGKDICKIYRSVFSFEAGCQRIKEMIDNICDKTDIL